MSERKLLLTVSIKSKILFLHPTIEFILTVLEREHLIKNSDDKFHLELILSELISNAMIHGNKNDEDKFVDLSVYVEGEKLIIDVIDEGELFEIEEKIEIEPLSDSGKGIYILQRIADKVMVINDEKKVVRVEKALKV